jgi:uncharacterized damage-inducible protein DinB
MSNSPMERYLATLEDEHARTVRVLRAFPDDQLDMVPAANAKTPRDLAWLLVRENGMLKTAVTTGFDWSKPFPKAPEPPRTMREIADALEAGHREYVEALRGNPSLPATVSFFTGPKQLGDIPLWDFLWFMLHDQIHHRGQFSVYLRLAGAKVPSIYGPSADEPWT